MAACQRPIDTVPTTWPTEQGAPHHRHRPHPSAVTPFCRVSFPTSTLYTDIWLLDDNLRRIRENLREFERRFEEKSTTRFVIGAVLDLDLNIFY